jgi:hypothetical protein
MQDLLASWLDLWRARPISVKSPLSPDAVVAHLDKPDDDARVVIGHVSLARVRLLAQRPSRRRLRNPWRPVLRGRIVPTPGGSRLVGSFAWLSGVRMATAAWLVAVVAFLAIGFTTAAGQSAFTVLILLTPGIVLAVGGLLLIGVAARAGRRDETFLREWLERRLSAS